MQLFEFLNSQMSARIESVQSGDESALKIYVELKRMSKAIDEALATIKDEALDDAQGVKSCEGVSVSVRSVGGRWDFKHLKDWSETKSKLETIEAKYKALYKTKELGTIPVDEETGEILEMPYYSQGSDAIYLTFPK